VGPKGCCAFQDLVYIDVLVPRVEHPDCVDCVVKVHLAPAFLCTVFQSLHHVAWGRGEELEQEAKRYDLWIEIVSWAE
jgi:hypothetical protein